VYHEFLWFDYFLQCSWIVAVVESIWAHPPAKVFRSFLAALHFGCQWDDATISANVRLMGESKASAVDEKIDLIVHFHGELFKKCPNLLMLAFKAKVPNATNPRRYFLNQIETNQDNPIASTSILPTPDTAEEDQRQEEEDQKEGEARAQGSAGRRYVFPPGFLEMFKSQNWTTVYDVMWFGWGLKAVIAGDSQ
jgi:hypothetical protein